MGIALKVFLTSYIILWLIAFEVILQDFTWIAFSLTTISMLISGIGSLARNELDEEFTAWISIMLLIFVGILLMIQLTG